MKKLKPKKKTVDTETKKKVLKRAVKKAVVPVDTTMGNKVSNKVYAQQEIEEEKIRFMMKGVPFEDVNIEDVTEHFLLVSFMSSDREDIAERLWWILDKSYFMLWSCSFGDMEAVAFHSLMTLQDKYGKSDYVFRQTVDKLRDVEKLYPTGKRKRTLEAFRDYINNQDTPLIPTGKVDVIRAVLTTLKPVKQVSKKKAVFKPKKTPTRDSKPIAKRKPTMKSKSSHKPIQDLKKPVKRKALKK
jgi:hypothetical protein